MKVPWFPCAALFGGCDLLLPMSLIPASGENKFDQKLLTGKFLDCIKRQKSKLNLKTLRPELDLMGVRR